MILTNGDYVTEKYVVTDIDIKGDVVTAYIASGKVLRFRLDWWNAIYHS